MMLDLLLIFWFLISIIYIFLGGRMGFYWVKQAIPFMKNKGAFYIKGYQSGYVDIDYSLYNPTITWNKDSKIKTFLNRPTNKERSSGCPVFFAYENQLQNFDPFNEKEPMKGSELYSHLLIREYNAGYNSGKQSNIVKDSYEKWIFYIVIATLLISFVGIVLLAVILGNSNDLMAVWTSYQPTVDQLIAAWESGGSRIV